MSNVTRAMVIILIGLLANLAGAAYVASLPIYVPAGSQVFEDGSFRTPTGRTGCLPHGLCQD